MRSQRVLPALAMAALTAAILAACSPAAAAVQAGFAERDITPEIGMEQPGGYHKSFHRSLHDPCKVRAAVFDDGQRRAAIVGVDALIVPDGLVRRCRERIEQECGLPGEAVMIAASHSHSSGPLGMVQPGEYDHASPLVQKLAYEQSSQADPKYLALVETAIVQAVCAADAGRVEVRCGFGSGREEQVAFNRRFRMRNGLSHTHPGQGNPQIEAVAGPVDPEVGVVGAWDADGRLLGCVVNFACHATTSPGGISANYIYYLEQVIRGALGPDVVVVFTAGASGDVTQVDNLSPYKLRSGEQSARFVGGRVGAEAVKVLLSVEWTAEATVNHCSEALQIPRRRPRPERVQEALQLLSEPPQKADPTTLTFAKEILLLDARLQQEPTATVEVQAIQVGPAVFVSNPAEYFCQYGLDIKAGSRFPLTYPVSLANGCVGYVPTEEALGPRGGGYETRLTSYSNLIPSAGRTIAEACIRLAGQLAPDQLPLPEPHAPFRGDGWGYGNVPPELGCTEQTPPRDKTEAASVWAAEILERLKDLRLTEDQVTQVKRLVARTVEKQADPRKLAQLTPEQEAKALETILGLKKDLATAGPPESAESRAILKAMEEAAELTPDQRRAFAQLARLGAELWSQIRQVLTSEQKAEFDRRYRKTSAVSPLPSDAKPSSARHATAGLSQP